jgi:hypothetical protein
MDYIKQAFSLSNTKKQLANQLYKEAVMELVRKDYRAQDEDAHTDLSALFGIKWLYLHKGSGAFWLDAKLYAEANTAFNYANFRLGIRKQFIELATDLVADDERISDAELQLIAKQMDSILTGTTEEAINANFVLG